LNTSSSNIVTNHSKQWWQQACKTCTQHFSSKLMREKKENDVDVEVLLMKDTVSTIAF
jgi:hypothetical protein